MKLLTVIVFVLGTGISFSQEWRDSLEVARKAYRNEDYEKALKYYKSAQRKAPDDMDFSDEIGQTAYKSGDYKTAEKVFQQSSSSKRSAKSKAKNFHNIGNSRMREENYQGAAEAYKESLRLNPRDEKTRYNLSEAMRKIRKQKNDQQQKGGDNQDKQNNNGQNDPQSGDSGDQQNGDQQDGQQNQGQGNQGNRQDGQDKKGQDGNPQDGGNQSQLPNKAVDRMLDELMKNEAETKRRLNGNGGGGFTPKSGKDW